MSTSNLSAEPELVVQSRKAAYCARRRLDSPHLTTQDIEDMAQTAALAYWKQHREGRPPAFCFLCARNSAEKYFFRHILGRNPRNPLSLDAPIHDGGDLPHEWLISPTPASDQTLHLDWLSDEVLEGVLFAARHAAGFSKRQMTCYRDTIQTDKRIIRLAARGHTNASISQQMGTTEGTIRNRRQRIRRLLETLLPPEAPSVEYSRSGGDQCRSRGIQLTYPGGRKPAVA